MGLNFARDGAAVQPGAPIDPPIGRSVDRVCLRCFERCRRGLGEATDAQTAQAQAGRGGTM
eukprot:91416-Chlamydomonas_euryale.AAC.7